MKPGFYWARVRHEDTSRWEPVEVVADKDVYYVDILGLPRKSWGDPSIIEFGRRFMHPRAETGKPRQRKQP